MQRGRYPKFESLGGAPKVASCLRRFPQLEPIRYVQTPGVEGLACVFELASQSASLILESTAGRAMTLVGGDFFLGTPGHRESTRWIVGRVPAGGLVPGKSYWVLADSGVVGELIADSALQTKHLGQVRYCGALIDRDNKLRSLRTVGARSAQKVRDRGAQIFLFVGTSAEVGKTTAAVGVIRALRQKGFQAIVALKASGTSSLTELFRYRDFGAAHAFDCVDFGLPTTYPSGRPDAKSFFARVLAQTLSMRADAVIIECGGDFLGANVPTLLAGLRGKRREFKVILAAADALGALGAKQTLLTMGIEITLITGPCTDSPTLRDRTAQLCGLPSMNLRSGDQAFLETL